MAFQTINYVFHFSVIVCKKYQKVVSMKNEVWTQANILLHYSMIGSSTDHQKWLWSPKVFNKETEMFTYCKSKIQKILSFAL